MSNPTNIPNTYLLDQLIMLPENPIIAIVGLGYVGLPLAVEFGKHFQTIGFDLSAAKIECH